MSDTATAPTSRRARTSREKLFASVPRLFLIPATLGIFLIAGPLLGLFINIPWSQLGTIFTPQVLGAANLSLSTAAASTLICGLLGAPLALVLSKVLNRSRMHRFGSVLYAIIYTPVILSPVVSGLGLLFFWGRKGMIGTYLYQAGISIPFTSNAVIIAQVFVALPFFVATAVTTCRLFPAIMKKSLLLKAPDRQRPPLKCSCLSQRPALRLLSYFPSLARLASTAQPSPSQAMCKAKPKPYPSPLT